MKQLLLSLLLSSGLVSLTASTAFAQSAPNTTQTDQSEEDWRKSKKKSTTDDPLDGFTNMNGWGKGSQRTLTPIDMLPEDSRRYLMKERAQRLAQAGVGEPVDTNFEPSEAAKSDANLEADEKAAWTEMMKDMGSPSGQASAGNPNGDPNAKAGQSSGAMESPSQGGNQGSQSAGSSPSASSMMRGGSSASVSDILAQLKGGGSAPQGQSPQGQSQQGQAQNGQSLQGNAPSAAAMQQAQTAGQASNPSQQQADSNSQSQAQSQAQNPADAQAQAQSDAAQAGANAQAEAQAQQAKAASTARTPEAISPLNRLKQSRDERASTGKRSSASDYLKRGN